jgi:hypothetical protein
VLRCSAFLISRDCSWSVPRPPATFLGFEMKLAKRLRGRKFRMGKPGGGVVAPPEIIDALRWGTSRPPSPSPPEDHDQSPRRGRPGWFLPRACSGCCRSLNAHASSLQRWPLLPLGIGQSSASTNRRVAGTAGQSATTSPTIVGLSNRKGTRPMCQPRAGALSTTRPNLGPRSSNSANLGDSWQALPAA